jgi:hypothetical protein
MLMLLQMTRMMMLKILWRTADLLKACVVCRVPCSCWVGCKEAATAAAAGQQLMPTWFCANENEVTKMQKIHLHFCMHG